MPNWCFTSMNITAPPSQIEAVANFIDDAAASGKLENGFGENWLGHILERLGYDKEFILSGSIEHRGSIEDLTAFDDTLSIQLSSAWSPHMEPVLMVCDCFAPDADITYVAEEASNGLFITNDPAYAGKVQLYVEQPAPEGFPEELLAETCEPFEKSFVQEVMEKDLGHTGAFEELVSEFTDRYEDAYLSVHEWEFVPLSELYGKGGE